MEPKKPTIEKIGPGIAEVLRWADERRAYYLTRIGENSDCRRDQSFYKGKAGMAAELQGFCHQFVRLTDDGGWEER